jgi:hypothetical protein
MGRHSAAAGDDADEVTDAGLTLVTGRDGTHVPKA